MSKVILVTLKKIEAAKPCSERFNAALALLGGRKKIDKRKMSFAQLRKAGISFDDLIWAASALSRSNKDIERRLYLWMADLAAHVHGEFDKFAQNDERPRKSIEATRNYARAIGTKKWAASAARAASAASAARAAWAAWAAWAAGAASAAERDYQFDR